MFWNLLLAHLLADYPLQPMWLVRSKAKTWGLVLHASIHFLTMLLFVGATRDTVWPQLLILAVFHFVVDISKYRLSDTRPDWVSVPYLVDQAIHILSIVGIAAWIDPLVPEAAAAMDLSFFIYASAYLLATHFWFVTEKTITHAEPRYNQEVEMTLWPRMIARAVFLTVWLSVGTLGVGLAVALQPPYPRDSRWRRALVTDLFVAGVIAVSALFATKLV